MSQVWHRASVVAAGHEAARAEWRDFTDFPLLTGNLSTNLFTDECVRNTLSATLLLCCGITVHVGID